MTARTTPVIVKRYGDKRLYDVGLGRYVTVDELLAWQAMSQTFVVRDAQTGEDVTAAVLAQPTRLH